ncbi:MAG: sodium:proline symporter [Bacteroidetes bacterium GWE2_29_8]|nr:MAG: sodium:proline symporter [Bacteroidetes bacterium GWE2_29_8]OFY15901.1 MAG: sodium:proline symporter [Bacteroidetes bacterium GWF2_29_10]
MQFNIIDWVIISLYLVISLLIGLWYKKRSESNITDFFLSGRNLPWYVAGISMVATTFAADTPLAVTELVAKNGISGNWLWWNMLIGGMLTVFFFARLWRRANVLTELELIEVRYGGKGASFLRSFKSIYLGLFMNSIVIAWVNLAMMSIISVFFGISKEYLILTIAGLMFITMIYSAMSGLWGVAITDIVQFIIAISGCIVLAIFVLNSDKIGGIDGLKEKVPNWSMNFFPNIRNNSIGNIASSLTISIWTFVAFIGVQWWASWYPGAEPGGGGYISQRMMSCKDEKHSIYATLFFQIAHYCLRPWPWIIVGLASLVLYPDLSDTDKKLGFIFAMRDYLPAGLKGLLFVAFLAAYMSTISTQMNWGASVLVNDFIKRFKFFNKENQESNQDKRLVKYARFSTLFIMVVSLFITTQIETISGVWSFVIECGAGLGSVLILRWFWWRINIWSEITATIFPFFAYYFSKYIIKADYPFSFFITVGLTTVAWILVTILTKPESKDTLKKFYLLVMPYGNWKPIQKELSLEQDSNYGQVFKLIVCWLSSIIFVYSILFLTGKLIFKEWNEALMYFIITILSGIVMKIFIDKTKILN